METTLHHFLFDDINKGFGNTIPDTMTEIQKIFENLGDFDYYMKIRDNNLKDLLIIEIKKMIDDYEFLIDLFNRFYNDKKKNKY